MAGAGEGGRIFAVSDIHTDHAENLRWCEALAGSSDHRGDALILAGDVTASHELITHTLKTLKQAFDVVFFTPGNHDLWVVEPEDEERTSMQRLQELLHLCAELDVLTRPAVACGAIVVPLLSWHHTSWDTEPDITGWKGIPGPEELMADFQLTRWPRGMRCGQLAVAQAVDELNDGLSESRGAAGGLESEVAALREQHPELPLISFSHFVPRVELSPEKRYLYFPTLAKAIGSTPLSERVSRLGPAVHVFGHTHFGWDATLDGVRYIQAALAYPSERRRRLATVCTGGFPTAAPDAQPEPLLVYDAASGFPPRYPAGWSTFYDAYPRRPSVTHMVPEYVASRFERVPGVGEVGWGEGVKPAWTFGPTQAVQQQQQAAAKRTP